MYPSLLNSRVMLALPFWCFHVVTLNPPSSGAATYYQPPSRATIRSKARPTSATSRQRTEARRLRVSRTFDCSRSVSPSELLDRHMQVLPAVLSNLFFERASAPYLGDGRACAL